MKTFLLTSLALAGIAISTPEAQAKKHKDRHHDHYSDYSARPSCESRYYRAEYYPREYSQRSYYVSRPRYSYSEPRYYRPEPCHVERRHSFRLPLISFLFGF